MHQPIRAYRHDICIVSRILSIGSGVKHDKGIVGLQAELHRIVNRVGVGWQVVEIDWSIAAGAARILITVERRAVGAEERDLSIPAGRGFEGNCFVYIRRGSELLVFVGRGSDAARGLIAAPRLVLPLSVPASMR